MTGLGSWIREVVALLFFITVVEALAPLRATRGYVRLATGVLLVLALLRPVLQVPGSPGWEEGWLEPYLPGSIPPAGDGGQLEEAQRRQALLLYVEALQAEAERVARTVPGVERAIVRAEVETDQKSPQFGTLLRLRVGVAGTPQGVAAVREALAAYFQVGEDRVEVEEVR